MRGDPSIDFCLSARRDWLNWLALGMGLIFLILSLSISPGVNCDTGGRCYPWFVWIARLLGGLLALGFGWHLLANPSRGIRLDPESGDLVWWTGSRAGVPTGTGRIHPSQIARIEIRDGLEDTDVRLIARDGSRVPGFSEHVLPAPYAGWANRLVARWPGIGLQIG